MKWSVPKNSLFAVLVRAPWWASLVVAVVLSAVVAAVLPDHLKFAGIFGSFPFVVVSLIAGWRQIRQPSAALLERTASGLQELDWARFAPMLQAALERDGYTVERSRIGGVDYELSRAGRRALLLARRWKSAHTGVEPLRQLRKAADAEGIEDAIYLSLGDLSEAAQRFSAAERLQVWQAPQLAALKLVGV